MIMLKLLWKIKKATSILRINFLLIFLSILSFSAEARSLTGYCFESNVSLKAVKRHVAPILARKDKVFERPSMNCIEVTISNSRKDLFETWIYKKYKPLRIYTTDGTVEKNQAMGQMPMCRMTVEKVSKGNSTIDEASVGSKNRLKRTENKSQGVSRSSLVLTSGVAGRIRMNNQEVFVTCHVFGSRYRVELSLDTQNSGLSTSVNASKGSRINIGEIVENLNDRSRKIDINKGVGYQKGKGQTASTYFLIIQ